MNTVITRAERRESNDSTASICSGIASILTTPTKQVPKMSPGTKPLDSVNQQILKIMLPVVDNNLVTPVRLTKKSVASRATMTTPVKKTTTTSAGSTILASQILLDRTPRKKLPPLYDNAAFDKWSESAFSNGSIPHLHHEFETSPQPSGLLGSISSISREIPLMNINSSNLLNVGINFPTPIRSNRNVPVGKVKSFALGTDGTTVNASSATDASNSSFSDIQTNADFQRSPTILSGSPTSKNEFVLTNSTAVRNSSAKKKGLTIQGGSKNQKGLFLTSSPTNQSYPIIQNGATNGPTNKNDPINQNGPTNQNGLIIEKNMSKTNGLAFKTSSTNGSALNILKYSTGLSVSDSNAIHPKSDISRASNQTNVDIGGEEVIQNEGAHCNSTYVHEGTQCNSALE